MRKKTKKMLMDMKAKSAHTMKAKSGEAHGSMLTHEEEKDFSRRPIGEQLSFLEQQISKHHRDQITGRAHRDIFFVWMLVVLASVFGAGFLLTATTGSPTGFSVLAGNTDTDATTLVGALFLVFVVITITAVIYNAVTKIDP